MPFSPSAYLISQGWEGGSKGLRENSRSKPITVIKKSNQSGIGRDRDEAIPWWGDMNAILEKINPKNQVEGKVSHSQSTR
jgi:hypothetical protein